MESSSKTFGREVIRYLQGKLKPVWWMTYLPGQKLAVRETMNLHEEDSEPSSSRSTTHTHGGEGLHANGLSGM